MSTLNFKVDRSVPTIIFTMGHNVSLVNKKEDCKKVPVAGYKLISQKCTFLQHSMFIV